MYQTVSEFPVANKYIPWYSKYTAENKEEPMLCTVIDIRGDYAFVKYDDTGVVSEVAIALLPFGVDVGDRLKFENYEFVTA